MMPQACTQFNAIVWLTHKESSCTLIVHCCSMFHIPHSTIFFDREVFFPHQWKVQHWATRLSIRVEIPLLNLLNPKLQHFSKCSNFASPVENPVLSYAPRSQVPRIHYPSWNYNISKNVAIFPIFGFCTQIPTREIFLWDPTNFTWTRDSNLQAVWARATWFLTPLPHGLPPRKLLRN